MGVTPTDGLRDRLATSTAINTDEPAVRHPHDELFRLPHGESFVDVDAASSPEPDSFPLLDNVSYETFCEALVAILAYTFEDEKRHLVNAAQLPGKDHVFRSLWVLGRATGWPYYTSQALISWWEIANEPR